MLIVGINSPNIRSKNVPVLIGQITDAILFGQLHYHFCGFVKVPAKDVFVH